MERQTVKASVAFAIEEAKGKNFFEAIFRFPGFSLRRDQLDERT